MSFKYLLYSLMNAYSTVIIVYVLMSWIPMNPTGIVADIYRVLRSLSRSVQEAHSPHWRYGGHNAHHRAACITIRSNVYSSTFLGCNPLWVAYSEGFEHGHYRTGHPGAKLLHRS